VSVQSDIDRQLIDADLIRLRKLMESHDWYYDFSDDYSVWSKGHQQHNAIRRLAESLDQRGVSDEVDELFKRYRPQP
jgi:hypothetical protein